MASAVPELWRPAAGLSGWSRPLRRHGALVFFQRSWPSRGRRNHPETLKPRYTDVRNWNRCGDGDNPFNPRPGGGLSHLRHGGGGSKWSPSTQKLEKLEDRAIRPSKALSEPVRSHFGHFSLRWILRLAEVIKGQIFEKKIWLSGMPTIISRTIIAAPNIRKQMIAHETLRRFSHQIWRKVNTLASRCHGR